MHPSSASKRRGAKGRQKLQQRQMESEAGFREHSDLDTAPDTTCCHVLLFQAAEARLAERLGPVECGTHTRVASDMQSGSVKSQRSTAPTLTRCPVHPVFAVSLCWQVGVHLQHSRDEASNRRHLEQKAVASLPISRITTRECLRD